MFFSRRLLLTLSVFASANMHAENRYEDDYTQNHTHTILFEESKQNQTHGANEFNYIHTDDGPAVVYDYTHTDPALCNVTNSYTFPHSASTQIPQGAPEQNKDLVKEYNLQSMACIVPPERQVYPSPAPCYFEHPCPVPCKVAKRNTWQIRIPLPSFNLCNFTSWCSAPCNHYSELYTGIDTFSTKITINHHGRGVRNYFGKGRYKRQYKDTVVGSLVGYTYRDPCGAYFNAEFDWASGKLNRTTNHRPSRYAHYYFTEGKFGYNFQFCNCLLVTPYVGFGFEYVNNHIVHTSLKLKYRNYFAALGGKIDLFMYGNFSIGLDAQWQPQLDSTVKLSQYSQIRFKLPNKGGFELQLPLRYTFCNNYVLSIVPFTKRSKDGASNHSERLSSRRVKLPEQVNQNYGGKVNLGILF